MNTHTPSTEAQPTTTPEAVASFESQGILEPGHPGWWKVWGASVADIRAGDLVLVPGEEILIADTFEAKAAPLRRGFVSTEGERFTLGALATVAVVRWGTGNTLAGSAR